MKLKLDFYFEANKERINHHSNVIFTGSCFAFQMHEKLSQLKLNAQFLGNGIVFHPSIIAEYIQLCLKKEDFPEHLVFDHNGIWHSWMHHGSVWANTKSELLTNINYVLQKDAAMLLTSKQLVVTFGSSYVYSKLENGIAVANCHKVPSSHFIKQLSSHFEMLQIWMQCINELKRQNPSISFIFSVSPVKYIKDGIHENNISKANLLILVNEICKANEAAYYFPAFEILQDELRDYRFYASDFSHPTEQAIAYIFELFTDKCIDQDTQIVLNEIGAYNQLLNHRILHANTKEHALLEGKKVHVLSQLKQRYPHLNW